MNVSEFLKSYLNVKIINTSIWERFNNFYVIEIEYFDKQHLHYLINFFDMVLDVDLKKKKIKGVKNKKYFYEKEKV